MIFFFYTFKCCQRQNILRGKPHFTSLQGSRRSHYYPAESDLFFKWISNQNILPSCIVFFPHSGHRESCTRFLGQTQIEFGPTLTLCSSPRCTCSPQTPSRHRHPQRRNESWVRAAGLSGDSAPTITRAIIQWLWLQVRLISALSWWNVESPKMKITLAGIPWVIWRLETNLWTATFMRWLKLHSVL